MVILTGRKSSDIKAARGVRGRGVSSTRVARMMGRGSVKARMYGGDARDKVKRFRIKLDFNNMVASGNYTPTQAANLLGANLRPGEQLTQEDYMNLSMKGELPVKKIKKRIF